MPEYLAPGVYIEEVPSGARPISAVSASNAAFFGSAPQATAHLRQPVFVTSFSAFRTAFVGTSDTATPLVHAVAGFFANGGTQLYVINLGEGAAEITADDLALLDGAEGVGHVSLIAAPGYTDAGSSAAMLSHCAAHRFRFAVLDLPDTDDLSALRAARPRSPDGGHGAVYTPWLRVADPLTSTPTTCPPSGHVCGIYADSDALRGVHKAPANQRVRGALGLTVEINNGQQEVLTPEGINCLRLFETRGIRVWGARTLAEGHAFDLYVNTRRTLSMIEESIDLATRWARFEANGPALWRAIERDIDAFLLTLWRNGTLLGATPEQAFFVRCDRSTMTQGDLDTGRMIAEIGVAMTKPAEFVVFRIGQRTADADQPEA